MKCKNGFTLVEIILVVSLISMVGIAVYKSIANGLSIWKASLKISAEEDLAIFLDKITHDLRNSYDYSLMNFEGTDRAIAFPTIVRTREDRRKNYGRHRYVDQMGMAEYYFDGLKQAIYRRQANYGQAMEEEFGDKRMLVSSVKDLDLTYYILDDGEITKRKYTDGERPVAVKIQVLFKETTGKTRKVERFVNIPTGTR